MDGTLINLPIILLFHIHASLRAASEMRGLAEDDT